MTHAPGTWVPVQEDLFATPQPAAIPLQAQKCSNCRYYRHRDKPVTQTGSGICCVEAPQAAENGWGVWPRVDNDDWCGEWLEGAAPP